GVLVSRAETMEEFWGARFFSESALSSRIKFARQALGDDGATQQWIRTIHGHGFRFVGEGTVEGDEPAQALDPVERVAEVMARPMVAVFPFEQETYDPAD